MPVGPPSGGVGEGPPRGAVGGRFHLGVRKELDGLRGIAISLVLFHHACGYPRGGFLGVDLFFVLSGFLITTLLIEESRKAPIDLGAFYARRVLRLLPALIFLLMCLLIAGGYGQNTLSLARGSGIPLRPWDRWRLGPEMFYTLFYCFNAGVVWQVFSPWGPLGVTWSLAIEEQFYLIWPWLLRTLLRLGTSTIAWILGLTLSLVCFWRAWLSLTGAGWIRLYYASDTRCDGLLVGCLLSLALTSGRLSLLGSRRLASGALLAVTACLAWAVCMLHRDDRALFLGAFTLIQLGFAVCLAVALLEPTAWGVGFLRFAPLRWLGKISYSLYLWHWPVKLLIQPVEQPGLLNRYVPLNLALSLALASFSFYVVEKPFLRWKKRFSVVH